MNKLLATLLAALFTAGVCAQTPGSTTGSTTGTASPGVASRPALPGTLPNTGGLPAIGTQPNTGGLPGTGTLPYTGALPGTSSALPNTGALPATTLPGLGPAGTGNISIGGATATSPVLGTSAGTSALGSTIEGLGSSRKDCPPGLQKRDNACVAPGQLR